MQWFGGKKSWNCIYFSTLPALDRRAFRMYFWSMARISAIHHIDPSSVGITPNANNSANDLAVYVSEGTVIKVYSPIIKALGAEDGSYQEWSLAGANRRLAVPSAKYTIYARLNKADKTKGYIVFAPQRQIDGVWTDKYSYLIGTGTGYSTSYYAEDNTCWYVRLGEVSTPSEGLRTVTFDTGILGTEQYNAKMEFVNSNIYYFGDEVTEQTPYLEHQEQEDFNGLHTDVGFSTEGDLKVGGDLAVEGDSSLGVVKEGEWQGTPIGFDKVDPHYIGRTRTQRSAAGQQLEGITKYQFEGRPSNEVGLEVQEIDGKRVLHTSLPFYSDSWVASGGVGSGSGSGGGGALYEMGDVKKAQGEDVVGHSDGSAAAEGDVLAFNSTTNKWEAKAPSTTGGDLAKTVTQDSPSSEWVIHHNLGKAPSVTVVDSAGRQFFGDVVYGKVIQDGEDVTGENDTPLNTLTIVFASAFSGVAYLN